MKRILLLISIFCTVLTAKAQLGVGGASSITGRISGTVVDSITKKPMDYATVSIFRSGGKSPINGVLTDEKGNFKLDGIHPGNYKIAVTFIGYPTKTIDPVTTTDSKPDKNLGVVIVAPSSRALKEVSVVGQAALVETHIDKMVYNAEKDLTAAGGNATDVLQKVPMVAVDINGNVSLRGDQNVRVLINGKPSGATSANLSDVLKTIPAAQIKSIEVITSPSAKYDAEGSAGIINIITKQKNVSGFSGSVSGGVGTRQNNGNANINYNKNRLSLSANIGGNATWPQISTIDFVQTFRNDTARTPVNASQVNHGTSRVKRHGLIGSMSAGYDFNSFNNFTTTLRINHGGFNTDGSILDNFTDYNDPSRSSSYTNTSVGHNVFKGFDWNADYTHKFTKEGHELSIAGQWSHSSIQTDYTNIFTARNPNQMANNNGINNEYTLQADYTLPTSKLLKIEAGGKTILRRINSDYNIFGPDPQNSGGFLLDQLNSNRYNYNQDVLAAYTVLNFTLPKSYSVLVGGRFENTAIKGDPINAFQTNLQPFSQNYNTFIPSLTLQKALTSTQTIKLAYSKRIQRPSLQFLNPFLNRSNVQSQSVGNPNLAPEVTQSVELNYSTFIKSSVINFSTYYRHAQGLIEGIAVPLNGGSGTITRYANIGNNNSFGTNFFGSITPFKILTIRGNINAYTYKPDPTGLFHVEQSQNGTQVQYNAFLGATLTLNGGFVAEAFVIENSPRRTIQGTNPSFSLFILGVKKQFLNKKASIGLNTLSPFRENKHFDQHLTGPGFTQNSSFAFPFRSFGITFSYNFGKLSFSNPTKKGINNDDLKQGEQNQGGGPAGGGAR